MDLFSLFDLDILAASIRVSRSRSCSPPSAACCAFALACSTSRSRARCSSARSSPSSSRRRRCPWGSRSGIPSTWFGIIGGLLGGLALSMVFAVSILRFKADHIVAGIAINLLALGVTGFALKTHLRRAGRVPARRTWCRCPRSSSRSSRTSRSWARRSRATRRSCTSRSCIVAHHLGRAVPDAVRAAAPERGRAARRRAHGGHRRRPRALPGDRVERPAVRPRGRPPVAGLRVRVHREHDPGPRLHRVRGSHLRPARPDPDDARQPPVRVRRGAGPAHPAGGLRHLALDRPDVPVHPRGGRAHDQLRAQPASGGAGATVWRA